MSSQEPTAIRPSVEYESDRAVIWRGDALDVLPTFETECFDLTVTDPPYGVDFQSGFRAESFGTIANDGAADRDGVRRVLQECVRLVGQKRHLYIFGPSDVLCGLKVAKPTELIWDKDRPGMGDLSAPWAPQHEPISFTVSLHRHGGQAGQEKLPVRLRKGSVLRFPPITGRKVRHPNEKPVALLRELIESSTRIGDTVLDPFAGSGSTGVAAVLCGRRAVLCEVDDRWLPLAIERVQAAERLADQIEEAS